ncbi:MAG: hypothetical protein EOP24_34370 [Hyphomicrobiales bacterium]|nr:MAG: hypothetical protein EOP24_34370 [Hyphomicrobiales bacterium]
MSTAFAAVALLMLVAMVVGIVLGIFVRGRRRRGWKIAGLSLLAFFVSVGLANYALDKDASKQAAVASTTIVPANTASPVVSAAPETDATERFGAKALSAYCDGYQQTIRVIREADDKFGIVGTDEKTAWIEERDETIGKQTEKAIGVPAVEWLAIASKERWDQRCEGLGRGWLLIEDADLLAAGDGDAHVVTRTLQAAYEGKVKEGSDLPFSRYRSASCEWKEFEAYHFVACTLNGGQNGFRSDPYLYFVGNRDGASIIVPFDHEARDHMTEPSYRDTDADRTAMPVGWYVGPQPHPVPYSDLRARFE